MARLTEEQKRSARALVDMSEEMKSMVAAWQAIAEGAPDIAHARRTIFLAYVAEGFSEAQALELCKTP